MCMNSSLNGYMVDTENTEAYVSVIIGLKNNYRLDGFPLSPHG